MVPLLSIQACHHTSKPHSYLASKTSDRGVGGGPLGPPPTMAAAAKAQALVIHGVDCRRGMVPFGGC